MRPKRVRQRTQPNPLTVTKTQERELIRLHTPKIITEAVGACVFEEVILDLFSTEFPEFKGNRYDDRNSWAISTAYQEWREGLREHEERESKMVYPQSTAEHHAGTPELRYALYLIAQEIVRTMKPKKELGYLKRKVKEVKKRGRRR